MKTYKYRIYPTKAQEASLERMLEECRWLYNKILETRKNSYEQSGISLGNYDTMTMIPDWKKERPSLKVVHSQVLQNVNIRVDLAFKAFFRRVKAGEEPGYPRFKGYGRYDSLCYPQYGNGVRLAGSSLILSKLGSVKVRLHRELCGKPKTVCIRRAATGKWFVTISCAPKGFPESRPLPTSEKFAGVDVGTQWVPESFATLSNGEKIANPRFFKKEEDALAKAQRKMSKLAKGTPERAKARKVVSRIHERITNKRTDFAHQQSRRLVNTYGVLVFEKLAVVDMMSNHSQVFGNKLNQSLADVAWSQLAQFTAYKAADAGRLFLQVDPRNTSKKCSRCGSLVPKDLNVRTHDCPHCGLRLDRDHNAAINILALGLQRVNAGLPDEVVEAPGFSPGE
ncbi:MAG: transposase [Caldilinea sp. CFX5]|nr:transposase [Caldilinea sp. CFX5]